MRTWRDYERLLEKQLCMACGSTTHQSHDRQRQCGSCRRKLSFVRRRQEWLLLQAFCRGSNAYRVTRELQDQEPDSRVTYRTALRRFRDFEAILRRSSAPGADQARALLGARPPTPSVQCAAMHVIFEERIRPGLPAWQPPDPSGERVPESLLIS